MSYLLVGGCSWSDLNLKSAVHREMDMSWPKWSEYLAEYLNVPLISVAKSGRGQYWNYNRLMEHILSDNPPKYVCWQLSQAIRRELPGADFPMMPPFDFWHKQEEYFCYESLEDFPQDLENLYIKEFNKKQKDRLKHFYKDLLNLSYNYKIVLDQNFKMIYQIKKICEIMNIKFFIFCSDVEFFDIGNIENLNNVSHARLLLFDFVSFYFNESLYGKNRMNLYNKFFPTNDKKLLEILRLDSFKILEKDHKGIYGWPFSTRLGGDSLWVGRDTSNLDEMHFLDDFTVSGIDRHPNKKGQIKWFEKLLPLLKEEWNI